MPFISNQGQVAKEVGFMQKPLEVPFMLPGKGRWFIP